MRASSLRQALRNQPPRRFLARGGYRAKRGGGPAPRAPPTSGAARELTWPGAIVVAVGGGGLFGAGVACAWVASASNAPEVPADAAPACSCACRVATFDALSGDYDGTVGRDEVVMGVPLLRWWLLRSARGEVLEVAAGTGANLGKYPAAATSIVATDASEDMLRVAAKKVPADGRFALRRCAVEELTGCYDTVVDTFGLCSVDDPVAALKAMQRATKHDGAILLLEHGRGHYAWLNDLLDRYAERHLLRWGCSWNRDYGAVMEDAGLVVESVRRFHFGTTYMVVARPNPDLAETARGA
jgi:methyltransferase OMS1